MLHKLNLRRDWFYRGLFAWRCGNADEVVLMMPLAYVKGSFIYAVMPAEWRGYRIKYRRKGSRCWLCEPGFDAYKTMDEAQVDLNEYAARLKLKELED